MGNIPLMEISYVAINIDIIYSSEMDKKLRQFLAVAETGNVSHAAELLHVTQPTISVNLGKLEDDHGVKLFNRSSRGMTLTDFGEVLYEHAKVMARISDHATADIRLMRASQEKAVRIGTGFSWWTLFVRDIVRDSQNLQSGTSIHVDVCSSLDGLRNLMIGDISFFLGTRVDGLSEKTGFHFETLFEVNDGFFVREQHPLINKSCRMGDLDDFPKLSVSAFGNRHIGLVDRDVLDPSFRRSRSNAAGWISTNSMFAGLDLLRATDAILTYPLPTQEFFAKQGIGRLDVIDHASRPIPIGIYCLDSKPIDENARQLLDAIKVGCTTQNELYE